MAAPRRLVFSPVCAPGRPVCDMHRYTAERAAPGPRTMRHRRRRFACTSHARVVGVRVRAWQSARIQQSHGAPFSDHHRFAGCRHVDTGSGVLASSHQRHLLEPRSADEKQPSKEHAAADASRLPERDEPGFKCPRRRGSLPETWKEVAPDRARAESPSGLFPVRILRVLPSADFCVGPGDFPGHCPGKSHAPVRVSSRRKRHSWPHQCGFWTFPDISDTGQRKSCVDMIVKGVRVIETFLSIVSDMSGKVGFRCRQGRSFPDTSQTSPDMRATFPDSRNVRVGRPPLGPGRRSTHWPKPHTASRSRSTRA